MIAFHNDESYSCVGRICNPRPEGRSYKWVKALAGEMYQHPEKILEISKKFFQAGRFPEVKESSGPGGGKNEFIAAISKIKGLGAMKAENLYDAGFHTVDDLKAANIDDVASVVGFTKLSASKAVNGAKDL